MASKLFSSGAPSNSKSVKGYSLYGVKAEKINAKPSHSLETWFKNKIVVQPSHRALVHLRFKWYNEVLSVPAVLFQVSIVFYWLLVGYLLFCVKKLFLSFTKDEVFTDKNAFYIMSSALVLMGLPLVNWINQELFLNCIAVLSLNDSGYALQNGASLFGSETFVGLAMLAFGVAFKTGINLRNENESFI
jgi:hypothetical protein